MVMKRIATIVLFLAAFTCQSTGANESPPNAAAAVRIKNDLDADGIYLGSGTVIACGGRRALVLTCGHLVDHGVGRLTIFFADGTTRTASLLNRDGSHDLAALIIDADSKTPTAPLADRSLDDGDPCSMVGYPGGQDQPVVRAGAALRRTLSGSLMLAFEGRKGDSGSGILRASDGRVVGVQWGSVDGETYAVDWPNVKRFVEVDCRDWATAQPLAGSAGR
jgi:S1-C subfamily serine protease